MAQPVKTQPMRVTVAVVGRVLGVLALFYLLVYVWPTPYKEYRFDSRIIRVNRVTGSQQILTVNGWE